MGDMNLETQLSLSQNSLSNYALWGRIGDAEIHLKKKQGG
jgi:hypothetical protein